MKILIIESDHLLQQKLIKFFNDNHYEIAILDSGAKAIEGFKSNNFNVDFILCDLDSPTTGGLDFLCFLQQAKIHIPFIFITTADNIHNISHKLQKGAWNYLQKPILNLNTLLLSIEQLCHREHLLKASTVYCEQIEKDFKDLEEDQLSGYKLQQQLLPKNNLDILSLNFSYFLHPSLYISGDFIDYQQLTDRYVIFYLSDVSGHGVGSAFVTVLLKACIQQYCSEFMYMNNNTVIDPKAMLATVNKVVCSENLGKYLTMVYMVYDYKLSKLSYSVAGHYPFPILIETNKSAKYIGERGYPIGMFKEVNFENYYIDLPNNFKIAIFSDGIMEVMPEKTLPHKEQAILDILGDINNFNSLDNLEILKNNLNINLSNKLPDDITGLIVTKR